MNPKVKEKLAGMAGDKGIDISVIMGGKKPSMDLPLDLPLETTLAEEAGITEIPEVSADSVYESIRDQFVPLDSDETLKVIHLILMDRSENTED